MKKTIMLPYDEEIGQLYKANGEPLAAARGLNHLGETKGRVGDYCELKKAGFTIDEIIKLKEMDML